MMRKVFGLIVISIIFIFSITFLYKSIIKDEVYIDIAVEDIDNVIEKEKNTYIVVYSEECISCKKLKSDIMELIENGDISDEFKIYGVNLTSQQDKSNEVLDKYQMPGVPFILNYEDEQLYNILVSNITQDSLKNFFEQ